MKTTAYAPPRIQKLAQQIVEHIESGSPIDQLAKVAASVAVPKRPQLAFLIGVQIGRMLSVILMKFQYRPSIIVRAGELAVQTLIERHRPQRRKDAS